MDTSFFVKEIRKSLGLTQQKLSELINKDRVNISLYETGRTIPPGDIVLKLLELKYPEKCLLNLHPCNSESRKNQEVA